MNCTNRKQHRRKWLQPLHVNSHSYGMQIETVIFSVMMSSLNGNYEHSRETEVSNFSV